MIKPRVSNAPPAQRAGQAAFAAGVGAALYTAAAFGLLLFLGLEPAESCIVASGVGFLFAWITSRMVQASEWRARRRRLEEIRDTATGAAALLDSQPLLPVDLTQAMESREERESREIQRALLPREAPNVQGYHFEVSYQPCGSLGGDLYDFRPLRDGKWLITLGDVSGKGPAGAIVMAMVQTLFRQHADAAAGPADLLRRVNDGFAGALGKGVFVTALAGILDPHRHSLTLAGAGHLPVLLINPAERRTTLVSARGTALGLVGGDRFRESLVETSIDLAAGDSLLFYTDGATESIHELERGTGDHRFRAAAAAAILGGAEGALQRLRADLFSGGGSRDDTTLLLLARNGAPTVDRRAGITTEETRA